MPHIESMSVPSGRPSPRGFRMHLNVAMMGVRDGFDDALDAARVLTAAGDHLTPDELARATKHFADGIDRAEAKGFHRSAAEATAEDRGIVRAAVEITEASGEWSAPVSLTTALNRADVSPDPRAEL